MVHALHTTQRVYIHTLYYTLICALCTIFIKPREKNQCLLEMKKQHKTYYLTTLNGTLHFAILFIEVPLAY